MKHAEMNSVDKWKVICDELKKGNKVLFAHLCYPRKTYHTL